MSFKLLNLALCVTVTALSGLSMAAPEIISNAVGDAASAPTTRAPLAKEDQKFVKEAAASSAAEIAMGNLAAKKAQSDAVRQFASHMVADHSKANEELKKAIEAKDITVTAEPTDDQKRTLSKLEQLSPEKFDKEYMSVQRKEHSKALKLFKKQAKEGKDNSIKQFAANTLPTLESHKKMADNKPEVVTK